MSGRDRSRSRRKAARARRLARTVLGSPEARAWYRSSVGPRERAEAEAELRRLVAQPGGPSALRPNVTGPVWSGRRLRAAAAVLLPLITAGLLWTAHRPRTGGAHRSDAVALFSELLDATRADRKPDPSALAWLEQTLPDESARQWFTIDPASPRTWDELEARLPEILRGVDEGGDERLLEPRGTIFEPCPHFRFEVPPPDGKSRNYALLIQCEGSAARRYAVVQGAGELGPLAFELPPGEELAIGRVCSWQVRLDPQLHADVASSYRPEAASFRVEDPARRETILALAPTGDADLDRLLRAAAFLGCEAAEDALSALSELSEDTTPTERELKSYFEAGARAILGDAEGFRALRQAGRKDG